MTPNQALDERLKTRESFARWYAVLVAFMAFATIWKAIPDIIDFDNPGQALFIGQLSGTVFGWVTAACTFFFFIQATEQRAREGRPPTPPADDVNIGERS